MTAFRTTAVAPEDLEIYYRRADDCYRGASELFAKGSLYASAILVVHATIAYADCLSIKHAGRRYSGSTHDASVDYYRSLEIKSDDFHQSVVRYGKILSFKHHAEYDDAALTNNHVTSMIKDLERFRRFILQHLPAGVKK